MKRSLFISVFAVFAAVACQMASVEPVAEVQSQESHTVSIDVEDPQVRTTVDADETARTAVYSWENTPNSFVHLFENGKEGSSASISVSDNGAKATLGATFSSYDLLGVYRYRAVIAGDYTGGIPSVPAVQSPAATSYDPAADILLGYSDPYIVRPGIVNYIYGVKMRFARANAVVRLELSNLTPGEKVELIEISATNNIAGPLAALDDYAFNGYDDANGTDTITLKYESDNVVPASGTFVAFFTCWAVKPGAFKISVATDKSLYVKSASAEAASAFEFRLDKLGSLKVDLENQALPDSRFELVTGTPDSWDGTYLFVSTDKAGNAKVLDATSRSTGYAADATIMNIGGRMVIDATDDMKELAWDISNSGRTSSGETLWNVMTGTARLIFSSAKYLYDNNGITVSSYNYSGLLLTRKYFFHMFSAEDDGVQMTSTHNGKDTYLGFNGSAFAYTSNSANRVFLFKYDDAGRGSQILAYNDDVVYWTLAADKYAVGGTYDGQAFTKSSSYQADLLSFTSSDPSVATVDDAGKITIKKAGQTTITAVAAASTDFRGASASYDLVISEPYYQKVTDASELVSGGKYIIVAKSDYGLLGQWYHAFDAENTTSFDYDVNTLSLQDIFNNPVYDGGDRIRPSAALDATQVVLEQGLLSRYLGNWTIKPVSVNKYLYCDTDLADVVSTQIKLPTYDIAFADGGGNLIEMLEQAFTVPHTITFDEEDGAVTISSVTKGSGLNMLGGTLFYSNTPYQGKFSYVNLTMFDQFDDVAELLAYLGKDTQYAGLLNLISSLGKNFSIRDIVNLFSADIYIYKYIG